MMPNRWFFPVELSVLTHLNLISISKSESTYGCGEMRNTGLGSEQSEADWSNRPQMIKLLYLHVCKTGTIRLTPQGPCENLKTSLHALTLVAKFCEAAFSPLMLVCFLFWPSGLHQGFFSHQGALCVSLQIQLPVPGEQMEVCSAYSYTVETGNLNLQWGNFTVLWCKTGNFFFLAFP